MERKREKSEHDAIRLEENKGKRTFLEIQSWPFIVLEHWACNSHIPCSHYRDTAEVPSPSVPGPSLCQRLHTAGSLWQGNPVSDTTERYLGVYSVTGHPPRPAVLSGAWEVRPRTLYTGEQEQSTKFRVLSVRRGTKELHRWDKYATLHTRWTTFVDK